MKKIAFLGGKIKKSQYEKVKIISKVGTESGYQIINGGYGGVMTASAEGALNAGGLAIGYTVAQKPKGNKYVKSVPASDFFDRLRKIMEADFFIIFPGGAGTIQEVFTLTYLSIFEKKIGKAPKKRIIIFFMPKKAAQKIIRSLEFFGFGTDIILVDDVEQVKKIIC